MIQINVRTDRLKYIGRWVVCLGVLLCSSVTPAIAGNYGESFLKIDFGARALGLGGTFISLADDGTAVYWNPAGLAQIRTPHVIGSRAFLFKSLADHHFVNMALPLKHEFALGISWIRLGVDNFPQFNTRIGRTGINIPPGARLGSVNDSENAYIVSLAKMYKFNPLLGEFSGTLPIEMPIALNFKYIRQSIGNDTSRGFGLDFGFLLKMGLKDAVGASGAGHLTMGITARDLIGTRIYSDTRSDETIKPGIRMGFSYTQPFRRFRSTLIIAEQHKIYNAETFRIGAEYWYRNALAIRVGHAEYFTTGAGIIIWQMMVDYAFLNQGNGGTHHVSASFNL